jgi:hypothetical protein
MSRFRCLQAAALSRRLHGEAVDDEGTTAMDAEEDRCYKFKNVAGVIACSLFHLHTFFSHHTPYFFLTSHAQG